MATMTLNPVTGTREFVVPFPGPWPGSPFTGPGNLLVEAGPAGPPTVRLQFFPTTAEFMAQLPALVAGTGHASRVFDYGAAVQKDQAVVTYVAGAATRGRFPAGLASLEVLEAFLGGKPAISELQDYTLESLTFEKRP